MGDLSDFARASKPGGNLSMGRTSVKTELGSFSVGVGSSMLPMTACQRDRSRGREELTAFPNARGGTENLGLILTVIDDCAR